MFCLIVYLQSSFNDKKKNITHRSLYYSFFFSIYLSFRIFVQYIIQIMNKIFAL